MRVLFSVLFLISALQLAGCGGICQIANPTEPSQVRWHVRFKDKEEQYFYGSIFEYFEGVTRDEVLKALIVSVEAKGYVVCTRAEHRQIYKQWGKPCAGCSYSYFENGHLFAEKVLVRDGRRISLDVSFIAAETQDGKGVWVVAHDTSGPKGDVAEIYRKAKLSL